jgi:hypothetical protein
MGAPVFKFATPKAFVQTTSPFVMQDTTAPGTWYSASKAGIRSSSARAKASSAGGAAWSDVVQASATVKPHTMARILGSGLAGNFIQNPH